MALAETAQLAIRIDLEGNASRGVQSLNKQLSGLQRGVSRAGRGVGQIGAGLTRAGLLVGGAAIAGITAAAKAAIDFEDAFAGVRKTVDEKELKAAGLSFETLAKGFREMATEIPVSAVELARIGETAGALGIRATDITRFSKVVAELGVTTNLSTDAAADALGRVGTILGLKGKDIDEFADSLVALGNAGASTESEIIEITKRFASQGKAAGLTKEEILGLASATSSLGFEPELGGGALSRVFGEMATNIALANKKGKTFSKQVGVPIATLQKQLDKGKGLPIFMDLLKELQGMSLTQASRFLKGLGVNRQSDIRLLRSMADNLPFVNEQLEIARKAQGALLKEAEKKFATTASKIQLFKNNLIEAGITMGEQFLPAVNRALDKIITKFKDPGFKNELKVIGQDIAAAIDNVNWDQLLTQGKEVVGILKGAVGWAKRLFDAFNALPGPVKEVAVGFLAIDKLSRGLVSAGLGNILGGLGETVIRGLGSQLPGVGRLFAQPVFVTNWPAGMGTGGPGGAIAKGLPLVGGAVSVAGIAAAAVPLGIVAAVGEAVRTPLNNWLNTNLQNPFAGGPGPGAILTGIQNLGELFKVWQSGGPVPGGPRQDDDRQRIGKAEVAAVALEVQRRGERTVASVDATKTAVVTGTQNTTTKLGTEGAISRNTVRSATATSAAVIANSQSSSASRIVAAIWAARPVVQVTNVTKQTTITNRYGPTGGSSTQDRNR